MNNRQERIFESYDSVLGVLDDSGDRHPKELLTLIARMRGLVAEIRTCRVTQDLAQKNRAVSRLRARLDRMRTEQMLPMARFGLRIFAGDAGMTSALKVPHKRAPTEAILAAAAQMAKALIPHRALLKSEKIDPARIGRLKRETKLLEKEFRDAYAGVPDRAVPTRRLAALMRGARLDLRAIDSLVVAHGSDALKARWPGAIRMHQRMGRPRKRKTSVVTD